MAEYLLDTTIIIDYLRGKDKIIKLIKKMFYEGSSLGCCPVNVIEVYTGMKERERKVTEEFIDSLENYELTKEIAKQAGEYKKKYQRKGISLSLPDVAIAAIAVANNLTLLTNNQKHYPIPELEVYLPEQLWTKFY